MKTYPLPLSTTPALTNEATLQAAIDCLSEHLPLEMEDVYTLQDIFAVLLRAASRGDSIEHTAYTLTGVPSSNDIRYHLDKYQDMATLEQEVNAALQRTITYLLAMLSPLRIRVKRLFLDRGFYSVPVIRWLKALNFPFLMPAIIHRSPLSICLLRSEFAIY